MLYCFEQLLMKIIYFCLNLFLNFLILPAFGRKRYQKQEILFRLYPPLFFRIFIKVFTFLICMYYQLTPTPQGIKVRSWHESQSMDHSSFRQTFALEIFISTAERSILNLVKL